MVELKLDVIVVLGANAGDAQVRETRTIPIVFASVADPVALGFVASLSRPGGNATGFTNFEFTVGGKWLETLKEIAPQVRRIGILMNPDNPNVPTFMRALEAGASVLGIEIVQAPTRETAEIDSAMAAVAQRSNAGIVVLPDNVTVANRSLIASLAIKHQLPAIYPFREFVQAGGLICYGVDLAAQCAQAAAYVDRILKGTKPADLPVQGPNRFEIVINAKAAKAIGLTIPPTLLARADDIIE